MRKEEREDNEWQSCEVWAQKCTHMNAKTWIILN